MNKSVTYDYPVLFDQSDVITESFSLHPIRKKAVVIADKDSLNQTQNTLFAELEDCHTPYESYAFTEKIDEVRLELLLNEQTMGTQLYIASKWDDAVTIFEAAIAAGFTEDEIQVMIDGEKRRYVYCMKCYTLNEADNEPTTTCSNCEIGLEVGPFFSKVRRGYIGYLIPEENEIMR